MSAHTVPIFAPDGSLGDIPEDQLAAAVKAGAKPGVHITGPDGSAGIIPADRTQDAVKAGAKIVPLEDQPIQHPGFWFSLGQDLKGMVQSAPQAGFHLLEAASGADPSDLREDVGNQLSSMHQNWQDRTAAGESLPYKLDAAAAEGLGVNVKGMEQSAKEGDVGGVAGHAAAVPTAMAATAALSKAAPVVTDAAPPVVRAAVRGANKALAKAPGTVGAAVGGAVGAASHIPLGAEVGAGIGSMVGKEILPKVQIPGEGFGLPNRVTGGPVNAPAYVEPPVFQDAGAPLPEKPPDEVLQAHGLAEGGKAPPKPQSAALADLPVHAVQQAIQELGPQAPIVDVTERANQIAKLGELLNKGLGGRPLEPNVPLRQQGNVVTPKQNLPEGHIPVESSALKSYKYDPQTREFESVTQNGQHYIHGDVSPEQAAKFEAADSKGRAWNELRKNSTLVAKVVNGKRIPVRPVLSDEDLIPEDEWNAGHELETEVEGTLK